MFQSILTNNTYTKGQILDVYNRRLIDLGDAVMAEHTYGLRGINEGDFIFFIKLKNLKKILQRDDQILLSNDFLNFLMKTIR